MKEIIKTSILFLLIFTVICGIIYPVFITGIAQIFFQYRANGSIVEVAEKEVGAEFIGQEFTKMEYFWGRLSATNYKYAAPMTVSSKDEEFKKKIEERKNYLISTSQNYKEVPIDLITYSASGVDPNISLESALFQVDRIAKARNMSVEDIEKLLQNNIENTSMPNKKMVNVLKLNIKLDLINK